LCEGFFNLWNFLMYLFYLGGNYAKFGHVREIEAIVRVLRLVGFAAKDAWEYLFEQEDKEEWENTE
jgi:hypothetical protein